MVLAAKLKHYLDSHAVTYRTINHERNHSLQEAISYLGIEPSHILQTVLLRDPEGIMQAVLPLSDIVHIPYLSLYFNRSFSVFSGVEADRIFDDCEPGAYPPLGEPYGLKMIIDSKVNHLDKVYFISGSHTSLVEVSAEDFQFMTANQPVLAFAVQRAIPSLLPY